MYVIFVVFHHLSFGIREQMRRAVQLLLVKRSLRYTCPYTQHACIYMGVGVRGSSVRSRIAIHAHIPSTHEQSKLRLTEIVTLYIAGWWRGTVVERRSLAGELSLSCA